MKKKIMKMVAMWAGILLASPYALAYDNCEGKCFKSVLCDISKKVDDLVACEASYRITNEDIPITIKKSGKYILCSDINWSPSGAGEVAITVNVTDVTIDFEKHTLRQEDSTQANCKGVLVNPNLYNIQLLNGTIENISQYGVQVLGGNSNLLFDSINTLSCGYDGQGASGGLFVLNVDNNNVTIGNNFNIVINKCNFNDNYSAQVAAYTGVKGCTITGAEQVVVQDSNFNNNSSFGTSAVVNGLALGSVNGVHIENCNFNQTAGLSEQVVAWPLAFYGCNDVSVINSQILDTISFGSFDDFFGMFLAGGQDFLLEGCLIQSFSGGSQQGAFAYAFDGAANVVARNCVAQNLYGTDAPAIGFYGFANGMVLENCVAQDIFATQESCGGFLFAYTNELYLKGCRAIDVSSNITSPAPGNAVAGFGVLSFYGDSANIIFEDCFAQNISAEAGLPGEYYGVGFYAEAVTGLEITNCVSQGNVTGYSLNTTDGFPVTQSTVQNSFAINNSFAGFMDNTVMTSNLFINNRAYLNNDNNYLGMHAGTPIRTWNFTGGNPPPAVNNFAVATSEAVDNWDIN